LDPNLARRAAELAQDGRNRLQGLVGAPGEASRALRSAYLGWASEVERLLREAMPDQSLGSSLQSPRHRDIVTGQVPPDTLWREVEAERDLRLRLLDHLAAGDAASPPSEEASELLVGDSGTTYRWFPQRPLGIGGYAQVFEGADDRGTELAVKRVPLRTTTTARWYTDARLAEREPAILARMNPSADAHVLPLIDQHMGEEVLSLVMPRAEHSLADLLTRQGPLDAAATRRLVVDAVAGLRYLADKGVLHRDLTPGNLLWWNGRWVLSDFGVARAVDERTSTYTWAHTGTHDYWAPELFRLEAATVRSDLYALGCVAFEALTGRKAFTGDDLASAHRHTVPDVPRVGDAALERAITLMLRKEPAARPPDARAVQQMLAPLRGLSPEQLGLQRAAARATRAEQERELLVSDAERQDNRRHEAILEFETLWEETARRAAAAVPEAQGQRLDDMIWSLTVPGSRLRVQLAEPAGRSEVLLLGAVYVDRLDDPPAALVANVRCRYDGDRARWQLLTFRHNAISQERPPLGPTRQIDGRVGMGLPALDGVIDRLEEPGPPIVITNAVELSSDALLGALTGELGE
jgi:serine/threonine-protein kinase